MHNARTLVNKGNLEFIALMKKRRRNLLVKTPLPLREIPANLVIAGRKA